MNSAIENKKNLESLLKIILTLKKELSESYLMLKTNFNPLNNLDLFNNKRAALKDITERIKTFGPIFIETGNEDLESVKEKIKSEMAEITNLNTAFYGLIKKNIYYSQLTISFITDAFNKSSIYNRSGANNADFFPLKNVLIGSGVRV